MGMVKFSPGNCCCGPTICYFYNTNDQGNISSTDTPAEIEIISGTWTLVDAGLPNGVTTAESVDGTPVHAIITGDLWKDEYDDPSCVYGIAYHLGMGWIGEAGMPNDTRIILCIDPGDGTGTRDCFEILKEDGDYSIAVVSFDFDTGVVVSTSARRYCSGILNSILIYRDFFEKYLMPPNPTGDPSACETTTSSADGTLIDIASSDDYTLDVTFGIYDNPKNIRSIAFTPVVDDPIKFGLWIQKTDATPFTIDVNEIFINRLVLAKSMIGSNDYDTYQAARAFCEDSYSDSCYAEIDKTDCESTLHHPAIVVVDFGEGGWTSWTGDNCQGGTWVPDDTACETITGEKGLINPYYDDPIAAIFTGLRYECFSAGWLGTSVADPAEPADCDSLAAGFIAATGIFRSTDDECKHCLYTYIGGGASHGVSGNSAIACVFRRDGADYLCEVWVWVWRDLAGGDPDNKEYGGFSVAQYQFAQATPFIFDSLETITLDKVAEQHYKSYYRTPDDCTCYYNCTGTLPATITVRADHAN
jgi:hypothetical protein